MLTGVGRAGSGLFGSGCCKLFASLCTKARGVPENSSVVQSSYKDPSGGAGGLGGGGCAGRGPLLRWLAERATRERPRMLPCDGQEGARWTPTGRPGAGRAGAGLAGAGRVGVMWLLLELCSTGPEMSTLRKLPRSRLTLRCGF